jgi:predicted Zn-dependent protease
MNRIFLAPVLATLLLVCTASGTDLQLPNIGDPSGQLITPKEERELGEAFMRQLRHSVPLVHDPEIDAYITALGNRLVASSDSPTTNFTFFVVKDPSINAFAGPGGYIGIHSGLFLASETESELAGVMAHEIAHVTQKHLLRAYDAASRMSLPSAAAMLAAILVATQDSEAGMAALASVQAASIQRQINFTRANEKEADSIGMQALSRSGFDPMGMPAFFERLQQTTRYYGDQAPAFLRTHPVTTDRIAEAQARVAQIKEAAGRKLTYDSLSFRLTQAKLRVLVADDAKQALTYFEQELSAREKPDPAQRYGHALALQSVGRLTESIRILKEMIGADPDRIAYRLALADVELDQGKTQQALSEYTDALKLYPANPMIMGYYVSALLKAGQSEKAKNIAEEILRASPAPSPQSYYLMAEAAGAAGDKADAYEAIAEYYYLNGQTRTAIQQLDLALRLPDLDHIQTVRIESRLNQFKAEALAEEEH